MTGQEKEQNKEQENNHGDSKGRKESRKGGKGSKENGTGKGSFLERTAVVWKTTLGSVAAWELARLTGSRHPYLAPLTLILCLQAHIGQSVRFAFIRSVGTVVGVLLIGFFAQDIPVQAWALGLALLVSTALMKVIRLNDQFIHQVALSILFVLYFENHSGGYAWDRAKDTLVGAVVGVLFVTLVFPTNEAKKVQNGLQQFVQDFVAAVEDVAEGLHQNLAVNQQALNQRQEALFGDLEHTSQALKKAEQGMKFNPYGSPTQISQLRQQLDDIRNAYIHFVSLTATFAGMSGPEREEWSASLRRLVVPIQNYMSRAWTEELVSESSVHPEGFTDTAEPVFQQDVSLHEFRQILRFLHA